MKLKQIQIAPWQGDNAQYTYSIIGLDEDGRVYTYLKAQKGWKKLSNQVVEIEEKER